MLLSLNVYLVMMGLIFALVVILAAALLVFLWIFNHFTNQLDIWKELKSKNVAVAILLSAAILGVCLIVSAAI